jgi:hypothetical protein
VDEMDRIAEDEAEDEAMLQPIEDMLAMTSKLGRKRYALRKVRAKRRLGKGGQEGKA